MKRLDASARRALLPWKIWLPVILVLLTLDATFGTIFWKIPRLRNAPDLSSRGTEWGYQIALDHQRLLQPKPAGSARVLAFGSSISVSFDPNQIQSLLQSRRPSSPVEVLRLLVPTMRPSEYLLLFESEPMPLPEVTVILFNLADFLFPVAERELNQKLRYIVPPMALWRARRGELAVTDNIELGFSSLSHLYRYRKLIGFCFRDHVRAGWRWLLGPAPPLSYGIHADGYTSRRFALELPGPAPVRFEYFVDPEWISQRGRVQLHFSSDGQPLTTRIESESGWKSVELPLPSAPARVAVSADSAWNPRAGRGVDDLRLLGVKLKEIPAPERIRDAVDDAPLLNMGGKRGDEFDRAWEERLHAQTEAGEGLRRVRDTWLALRDEPFVAKEDYLAMQKLVQHFRARGSRVILVNTPDKPYGLGDDESSRYYRDYLEFFRSLASASGVGLYDLSASLPAEDFNDWYHVNYIGTIKLGRIFTDMVERALPL